MATYAQDGYQTWKIDDDDNRTQLANFTAKIVEETRTVDGDDVETSFTIEGLRPGGKEEKPIKLPAVEVTAAEFPGMTWVMRAWGTRALVFPGGSVKEDLRAAIQLASNPKQKTIYKNIGWTEINKKPAYLHAKGAITAKGNDPRVTVLLPQELAKYDLSTTEDAKAGFLASLSLIDVGPPMVTWTLWAATYAPIFGPVDFATHISGRTGTFKSELVSLFQSHYGPEMDARNLPGSWSSTANAIEAQAYYTKNAVYVVDDFVPLGSQHHQKSLQQSADKVIRAAGNQSGRARLTDASRLQTTMYPRGLIMSTGEDTPEGHSVRARMMIMELSPGDVGSGKLTEAQKKRPLYSASVAGLIVWLCKNPQDIRETAKALRDASLTVGHARTAPMLGTLIAAGGKVLEWAADQKYITKDRQKQLVQQMTDAITECASKQQSYLENADPVELFCASLRQVLTTMRAHIRSMSGGVPKKADQLGWSVIGEDTDIPQYKAHGPCIGWVSWDKNELYVEVNAGYAEIKKIAGNEMTWTRQTLLKRLKEGGALARTDETRQRNTLRIVADNSVRHVLCMQLDATLDCNEVLSDTPTDQEPDAEMFVDPDADTNKPENVPGKGDAFEE